MAIYHATFDKLGRILKSLRNDELIHDAIQEAYLKLWAKFEELDDHENYMPFLYFYARTYALKQITRDLKRELLENNLFRDDELIQSDQQLEFREYHLHLSRVIERLPPKRREIYRLFREEGLSYKSIGEKLRISCKTVDSHLTKASKTIKQQIYSIYGMTIQLIFLLLAMG